MQLASSGIVALVAGLALMATPGRAVAAEEPEYEVVEAHDDFELRRYGPQLIAEVDVEGDFDDVGNDAFRVLAGFITGENRGKRDIAMTAPVTQTPAGGERIAMTAPVTQTPATVGAEDSYAVAFVMPSEYTRSTLPEPTDPRVRIREVPGKLVAARRYSGRWTESHYREQEAALLRAVAEAGLTTVGTPVYARYNSPFTLWFLRRNEVWVEVEPR